MSEVTDILELVTKKFELLNKNIQEQNAVLESIKAKEEERVEAIEKVLKELTARRELEEDQIAELDRLTQRTSTQLKVMIQLSEKLERAKAQ